ncbi:MAG: hypothetical protein QOD13_1642 [Thermoleophilaceae bacterium]|jgi:hypothetical protein|nr:hypothetical protein [Thermoleophilaceae bacterium]
MDAWSVQDELERLDLTRAEDARVKLVRRIAAVYRDRGLLDYAERRLRLSTKCPRHHVCWQGDRCRWAPDTGYDAVALPWIGNRYEAERILVIGTNFHDQGGLGAHWDICRSHISAMTAGKPGHDGRPYAARVMSAVRAVRESRAKRLDEAWEPPPHTELADDWESIAYIQAVKCAPGTARSAPFRDMYEQCPSLTLMPELEALAPRVVILLGRSRVRDSVRALLRQDADLEWDTCPGSLERDTFTINGAACTLFCLNHPAARDARTWKRSLSQLIEQLIAEPVG